jgi:riboflavin kinase / FMN adenylyltransferase
MRLIHALADAQLTEETVVTIGSFDGVHRGHQSLIAGVRAAALAANRAAVVVTFFPHPSVALGRAQPFYLTSPEEKRVQINQTDVDLLIELPFTPETATMRAGEFVDRLVAQVRMRELWIGHDFALGYRREGNAEFLARLGETRGFTVKAVEPISLTPGPSPDDDTAVVRRGEWPLPLSRNALFDFGRGGRGVRRSNAGEVISSSAIRAALKQGEVAHAARLLGRWFRLSGRVVPGDGRGRTIGSPTANLDVWPEHAMPANGIYACRAWIGHIAHVAAVNIGTRPTVTDRTQRTIEAHLLDFDQDLYGLNITLDFVERLRGEQKFNGVSELAAQIAQDVARTRRRLNELEAG